MSASEESDDDGDSFASLEECRWTGEGIARNSTLVELDYSDCALNGEKLEALFGNGRHFICPLRSVDLSCNEGIGSEGMGTILPFLRTRSHLKSLNLSRTGMGNEGAMLVSEVLDNAQIEALDLGDNAIWGEGFEHILRAPNAANLTDLNLFTSRCGRLCARGLAAIMQFLSRDDTLLRKFSVNCSGDISNGKKLAGSISKGSKLRSIEFYKTPQWSEDDSFDEAAGVYVSHQRAMNPILLKLVCDESSFDSLIQSNHELHWYGELSDSLANDFSHLGAAFDINARSKKGDSIIKRLRCKLRTFYFDVKTFDVQPFVDLNVKLVPFLVELVSRTEINGHYLRFDDSTDKYYEICNNLNGIYRLIRNCHLPEMFCFPSPEYTMYELESKMQQLEAKMAALHMENSKLKQTNEKLVGEIKDVRNSCSSLPNKRQK